jgi:hypothetical protein
MDQYREQHLIRLIRHPDGSFSVEKRRHGDSSENKRGGWGKSPRFARLRQRRGSGAVEAKCGECERSLRFWWWLVWRRERTLGVSSQGVGDLKIPMRD